MMTKFKQASLVLVGCAGGRSAQPQFLRGGAARGRALPLPVDELRAFAEVFGAIKANYVEPVEDKKLITEAISGMLTGLDPHSAYLDQDAFSELQVGTQGEFGGLGIEVGMEEGFVKVVSPIEDTPAFRAGVKPGDFIIKIDDALGEGHDAERRGEAHARQARTTSIRLTILRKGEAKPFEVTLIARRHPRAEREVQADRARLRLGPRVAVPGAHRREPGASTSTALYKQRAAERPDPRPAQRSRRAAQRRRRDFLRVPAAASALVVSTDGRTEDAKRKFIAAPEDYLRGNRDDYLEEPARGGEDRADGGAGQRRLGLRFGDRRGRACRTTSARRVIGTQTFGKGSVQTITAARQQHRDQAHHGALLHAERPFDPGEGHHARYRRRGPDLADRRRLARSRPGEASSERAGTRARRRKRRRRPMHKPSTEAEEKPPAPLEFASDKDFQFQQAVKFLKGVPLATAQSAPPAAHAKN